MWITGGEVEEGPGGSWMVLVFFAVTARCTDQQWSACSSPGSNLLLGKDAFQANVTWSLRLFLLRHRTLHFPLLNFIRLLAAHFPSLLFSLYGNTILLCISHSSQFCTICELAEGAFCTIIWVINEDFEQFWPWYQPLWYTTSYFGLLITPLSSALQFSTHVVIHSFIPHFMRFSLRITRQIVENNVESLFHRNCTLSSIYTS